MRWTNDKAGRMFEYTDLKKLIRPGDHVDAAIAKNMARIEFELGNIPVMPHLYFTQFIRDEGFERVSEIMEYSTDQKMNDMV